MFKIPSCCNILSTYRTTKASFRNLTKIIAHWASPFYPALKYQSPSKMCENILLKNIAGQVLKQFKFLLYKTKLEPEWTVKVLVKSFRIENDQKIRNAEKMRVK